MSVKPVIFRPGRERLTANPRSIGPPIPGRQSEYGRSGLIGGGNAFYDDDVDWE
jgi:hypothetical protein